MAVLSLVSLSTALLLTPRMAPMSRAGSASMAVDRKPGEGDPFSEACPKPGELEVKRGDMGIERWHSDSGYIEEDDEPWHSTCKSTSPNLSSDVATAAYTASLPFLAPESALQLALSKVKSLKDVDTAVADALAAGARPGCPAIMDAEKIKKAAEKAEGKVTAGKAPKDPAQGAGWDNMKRALGKVHDNSVA